VNFDETEGSRAELALQLLADGKYVSFRGLGLRIDASGALECRVFSRWNAENVTEAIAREAFAAGARTLEQLCESPRFAALLGSRSRMWELLDDYGQGAVGLCRWDGVAIQWSKGYPR
jgi:hypothetical protein